MTITMLATADAGGWAFLESFLVGAILVAVAAFTLVTWRSGCRQAIAFDRSERALNGQCPDCGYDLRGAGHERCPECGEVLGNLPPDLVRLADPEALDITRLRNEWPNAHLAPLPPMDDVPLALIHATMDGAEADLVVEQLTARGICCFLEQDDRRELSGSYVVSISYYRVRTPASEREVAAAILNRFRRGWRE